MTDRRFPLAPHIGDVFDSRVTTLRRRNRANPVHRVIFVVEQKDGTLTVLEGVDYDSGLSRLERTPAEIAKTLRAAAGVVAPRGKRAETP